MYQNAKLLLSCLTTFVVLTGADLSAQEVRHEVHFPDVAPWQTLVCDFHMHTVFSDGNVWPPVRVSEAWRQGLDAISITDHIEYQPHKDDVPTKYGRWYDLAIDSARLHNLLLVRGAEITRDTPPGHFNAIFLQDESKLDTPEFLDAVKAAYEQGAFIFWNHQAWQGEEKGRWMDVHSTMYEGKMLHGMEVCNGESYYPTAHRWCLDKNLTMVGNTDIHDPDLLQQSAPGQHRTMTLVFAADRTVDALKESLMAGRTVVWYKDQLIGRSEYLEPLFQASVSLAAPIYRSGKNVSLQLHNACDVDLKLVSRGGNGPATMTLPAQTTTLVRFSTAAADTPLDLQYTVTNLLMAPETGLPVVVTTQ